MSKKDLGKALESGTEVVILVVSRYPTATVSTAPGVKYSYTTGKKLYIIKPL